jgi:hypothetical protein
MRNFRTAIITYLLGLLLFAQLAQAAWLSDYRGSIGDHPIGLTIEAPEIMNSKSSNRIVRLHYYYVSHLQDIRLLLKEQNGRTVVFDELDAKGQLVATFNLTLAKTDPQNHFRTKDDLDGDILIGDWVRVDGAQTLPVYLQLQDNVTGDGFGGRCGLHAQDYLAFQEHVKQFYVAAKDGDEKTLKKKFKFKMPHSEVWRKEISKTIPHDLFCNWQGYMLGNGIVWFNDDGSIINRK